MLDIKLIRENPQEIEKKLQTKNPEVVLQPILSKDEKIRKIKTECEELKAKRNHLSKQIGDIKRSGGDAKEVLKEVAGLGDQIDVLDKAEKEAEQKLEELLSYLPNLPEDHIKVSEDPEDNICLKEIGEKRHFNFKFKNHLELNEHLHLFDFKASAKISGSSWPLYTALGARLEWALINYMIDTHIDNGYTKLMPPLLAKPEIVYGAGQLPKFENQLYKIHDEDYQLYLIPTAEVAICGLHYDEILKSSDLPQKYFAYTPCFRREAGAAGSQERGLIRMHQFNKVEMFAFTKPEESHQVMDEMIATAEEILQSLNLHYRVMELVTGDMSFPAAKTVDIEVWLPGQNRYYEVSSVSNCTDFQARRSHIRYKEKEEKPQFVHTLNGSGLATSRLMVALLENHQQEDGSILLPPILHKYLDGMKELKQPV